MARKLTENEKWGRPFTEVQTVEGYKFSRLIREREGCSHPGCGHYATWLDRRKKVCKSHVGIPWPVWAVAGIVAEDTSG